MSYLVVSSLADLPETVARHGALDLVTLINADTPVPRPATIEASRPDNRLIILDFPTFGGPTIAT